MKKAGRFLAALIAFSIVLNGCGKLKDVKTTSVYVNKNGVVTEAIVEDYGKEDDYTEEELKTFVENDVKKFTEERGDKDSVKLEKCQIAGDKVEIRMEYGDYQSYADYHGAEFFAGTLEEAKEAGYDFSASFVDSKGETVSVEDAVKGVKNVRVIVCEEPMEIVTDDPVLCVSESAIVKGTKTVDTTGDRTTASTEETSSVTASSASAEDTAKTENEQQEYEEKVLLAAPVVIVYGR